MAPQKYPIGVQTFSEIIEKGYTYVDKTAYVARLTEHGKYIFLSRPRRFGKSLLVSTLEAYFEGKRELFKGLALYRLDVDWTPSPVLHFDFNTGLYTTEFGLLAHLHNALGVYEREYGIPEGECMMEMMPIRFSRLIRQIYDKTGQQVVILVDEYDKPLLAVEENSDVFEMHQTLLKSFFGNLKSMDRYIRFAFLTGVARFSNVSIFSDVNNLDDISLSDKFADICGWSEQELTTCFEPSIRYMAAKREEDYATTLCTLRQYYDGYLFSRKGVHLYNPYSVLKAFREESIKAYWFESGTPTFLVRWVKANHPHPESLNGVIATEEDLTEVGFDHERPVSLMFQTGYLTIGSYDSESELYELRFPNREVEIGFYRKLLPLYAPATAQSGSGLDFTLFKKDLADGRINDFMDRLATLLKGLPGTDHCESNYRATTYLLCMLCGTEVTAEKQSYKGRSDLEALTPRYVYVFEFKYNKSVKEAMDQLYSRDYAGCYRMDSRTVYLIGANYDEKKDCRGLTYKIETLDKKG